VETTWIALLRAINVGGRNRVPMAALRDAYREAGCGAVTTYIQSGNVVLTAAESDPSQLGPVLEEALQRACGVESRVVLRTAIEWAAVTLRNPFADLDSAHLAVTFLSAAPDPERVRDIEGRDIAPDRVRVVGRDLYWYLPAGFTAARLSAAVAERLLGPGTARNLKTVARITELVTAVEAR